MAIFEYYSPDSNKIYTFFARNSEQSKIIPACPDDKDFRMEKLVSGFAVVGETKKNTEETEVPQGNEMDDPRMQMAMKEMEGAISSIDEENPDPKVMGQLMRKMADITGESMDEGTEEMIRKLEEGKDPEALEAEMESFLQDSNEAPTEGNIPDPSSDQSSTSNLTEIKKPNRKLVKDPTLYDYTAKDLEQLINPNKSLK